MNTSKIAVEILKTSLPHTIEEKILDTLLGAKFENWYKKDFRDFVVDENNAKSNDQILKDIKSLFDV